MQSTNFRSLELAIAFHEACLKAEMKGYIRNQLDRASLSVVLNLQEGAAKPTQKDKRKFYATAYGSVRECQAIMRLLGRADLFEQADKIGVHVWKLMKSR
jgi:four helix bundle protein